ncbi:hypothetical protein LTR16_000400 [Cryomyces antarcticus]|uniref:DUF7603 domain-containing protein n=1 Tax=Cryomyces antarcticus TaxID=329879 RepID=A0ABR0MBF3_9PEZI|nr:hypothetical protein LTR39_000269 [Cryomyces antarcticus]KAK5021081.1 hypothetical protein LTR60_000128 [Cryomyces antarcticus]KAK5158640.1 hypothetical protein LTR04_005168 [Oleoguttula sp. CCFEE 6159]KAK5296650.1 hypothetical protein LTR16_000400 [Cryomyces antarcticus]
MEPQESTRERDSTLGQNGVSGSVAEESIGPLEPTPVAQRPNSPRQRLTPFFGWKPSSESHGTESPDITISDRSPSPTPSPLFAGLPRKDGPSSTMQSSPPALYKPKTNEDVMSYFTIPVTPMVMTPGATNEHVEELQKELREVSLELAGSIRREMELEDEVDRWKTEIPAPLSEASRRTSDYYSDSGTSSIRYPNGDSDTKIEELERARRRAEQGQAQLRVDMAQKVQDGLRTRRDLESRVRSLEEQLFERSRSHDTIPETDDRVRELEASLEDVRRRLIDERQSKDNFEDLYTVLNEELARDRKERDGLRDVVVPQLRARVESLETETVDLQTFMPENSRMQKELQALREENERMQFGLQLHQPPMGRFKSIAEGEQDLLMSPKSLSPGLTRSNSLARTPGTNTTKKSPVLRSNPSNDRASENRQASDSVSADRLQDIEDQRDALHHALKSLLERQTHQRRDHERALRALTVERDKALNGTCRRTAFNKEVLHLRDEVNQLRRRADEALEQKWLCEKGLSGLKMDLDRAEQETSSLRDLLQERDIFLPERPSSLAATHNSSDLSASISLDKAYKELQTTHALSLARIRDIDGENPRGEASTEAEKTMELLKKSISDAEFERDVAIQGAEGYRQRARLLQGPQAEHLGNDHSVAAQLYESATRMDELASQVQQQLKSNTRLRQRLAEAIERGEREQKASATRIVDMQGKLKTLEDKVLSAQQHSEEATSSREEEVQRIKESHNSQLQRTRGGLKTPSKLSPYLSTSPLFAAKSPRLDKTSSGLGLSMAEASQTKILTRRVEELEKTLSEADSEMEEVVQRMNMAQIEVVELQSERDEATRQTRRLQAEMLAERERVKALMS